MHQNLRVNLIQHEVTPWRTEYLPLSAVCLCLCVCVAVCICVIVCAHVPVLLAFPALLFVL